MSELKRQVRVINMMGSMHSMLYEKYKKIALFLDVFLIVVSICINAFVFINPKVLNIIGLSQETKGVVLGISSILIFSISIILFRIKLKEKARSHEDAVNVLTRLKVEYNNLLNEETKNQDKIADQVQKYSEIVSFLPKIPDSKFNKLKRKHEMKVLVSKTLSSFPGTPVWIIKYTIFRKHYKRLRKLPFGEQD